MSDLSFSIESLLAVDAYPHSHAFTDGVFKGLTIWFRSLPTDSAAIVESTIGDRLAKLGFTNVTAAVLHLIGGVTLTGAEFQEFEDASDRLTASQRVELDTLLTEGLHAVVTRIVGRWSAREDITRLPELLKAYPALVKSIFELANGVTLGADKQALAKK